MNYQSISTSVQNVTRIAVLTGLRLRILTNIGVLVGSFRARIRTEANMIEQQANVWKAIQLLTLGLFISSCTHSPAADSQKLPRQNLQSAEALIDAFYSFDPAELKPFLSSAEGSAPAVTYYQGWADGGNYKIVERQSCKAESAIVISCSITVEDDPVLALNIDFNVTDTFTITFSGTKIVSVETNSNDQQIYYDAFNWVTEEMPDVMNGPCQGFFNGGPTPGDCARAMTEGYRRFTASDAYPHRQAN